jgi:AraC-like DNA-binding protein
MAHPKEAFFEFIEQAGGPPLIAYWDEGGAASEYSQDTHKYDWHNHVRGQFWCVESGLVHIHTARGSWLLPPHRAGWMPPGEMHTVTLSGTMRGWGIFLAPDVCTQLPDHPCVIGVTPLMQELVHRASSWKWNAELDARQQRVMDVLLDEMLHAAHEPLHLPMPIDRRLLRIAQAVIEQPQDNRGLEDWAAWAGLSPRTLSRLFRAETALSFAQWRQQARLARGLEQLADGVPVASVADALGYASTSAFIAMFRRCFGHSPARYFGQRAAA